MGLSERKKKILQILVDEYINTAAPVSSKTITENHLTNVSSATVRSELSALEEMGYLSQLHTSSGRVPSPMAYKLYVNELMEKKKLSKNQLNYIESIINSGADNLEYVVKNTLKVISELTDYTTVAMTKHDVNEMIESVKLLNIKPGVALLLIVTENNLLKDNIIGIPQGMSEKDVEAASDMLNKILAGKKLGEVADISEEVDREFSAYRDIFASVLGVLRSYCDEIGGEIVLEGEEKILNQPEYTDVDKVKNFLSVVTSKDKLASLLTEDDGSIEINIKIGRDGGETVDADFSLVPATYSAGGVKLGTYGVIGPMRMDYPKVITVLENVGKVIENIVKNKK